MYTYSIYIVDRCILVVFPRGPVLDVKRPRVFSTTLVKKVYSFIHSLPNSLSLSLPLSLSVCLSVFLPLSLCLYLSVSVCLSLSLSLSLCLSLSPPPSLIPSPSLSLPPSPPPPHLQFRDPPKLTCKLSLNTKLKSVRSLELVSAGIQI